MLTNSIPCLDMPQVYRDRHAGTSRWVTLDEWVGLIIFIEVGALLRSSFYDALQAGCKSSQAAKKSFHLRQVCLSV